MGYPSNHYNHLPHNIPYYPPDAVPPSNANSTNVAAYRYPPGSSSSDWGRERDFDYRDSRREYRAPPPSGAS